MEMITVSSETKGKLKKHYYSERKKENYFVNQYRIRIISIEINGRK